MGFIKQCVHCSYNMNDDELHLLLVANEKRGVNVVIYSALYLEETKWCKKRKKRKEFRNCTYLLE